MMTHTLQNTPTILDILPREEMPLRKRRLLSKDNAKDLAQRIVEHVRDGKQEREDWMNKRLARYTKLRGLLEERNGPWDDASNQHIPIMFANSLRVQAGLFNAVLGIRPVIFGKPTRPEHREIAERNDHLLDHQMFVDQDGDRRLERWITQFVDDGTAFAFQPRIRETHTIHESRVLPKPDRDLRDYLFEQIPELAKEHDVLFTELVVVDNKGYSWEGTYDDLEGEEHTVVIECYEKSKRKLELIFEWDVITFDGPTMLPSDLEDIVAPMRSENLQPVSGHNPTGSAWVAKISRITADTLKRRVKDGTYDMLSEDDVDEITGAAVGPTDHTTQDDEDAVKNLKDVAAGLQALPMTSRPEEEQWIVVYEWYGTYDLNDDGLDEEVICTVIEDPVRLARVRYLSELYPGIPPMRPFAEARFIPVPGQLYGIGLPELMEGLSDFLHELINDNVDAGRIASLPWFGYRASSGFKPETLRLEPGMGIPLDNPQQDLAFYNMPHADQTWSFNMIGLGMQMMEKLVQIGPLQFGQVPQGKASALRTVGTTVALLQQGAAMPEQILRRLLMGIRDVFAQFHLLNTRYLPPKKRFLVVGKPLDQDEAYGKIDDRQDINIPLTFDFQATLLNTNKGVVGQSLMEIGQALVSPLFIQLGLVTPEQVYNWAHDIIQSGQLDPSRYLKRPVGIPENPRIAPEEALLDITNGVMPASADFTTSAQEAFQFFIKFMQSDEFGLLTNGTHVLFKNYIQTVMEKVRQEIQQQQMMQAATQFSQTLGQGQGGGGGRPPEIGSPPETQTQAPSIDELTGAEHAGAIGGPLGA